MDADKLAAHNVTAQDVYAALGTNNYIAAVGTTKGQMVSVDLTAATDLHSVDEFKQLIIKQNGTSVVRLQDVADVVLGAENYDLNVAFSGKRSVFIGIKVAPEANILDVAKRVRQAFPELQRGLPTGVTGQIVYDSTEFINTSIFEVVKTLIEALVIVTIVIFLFLGSFRAVLIPVIAMPLSLIGTFFVMLVLGYSINLLTLLALVLAIGLVVDDAIIVVENVDRHMKEEGRSPFDAAIVAARELGGPIHRHDHRADRGVRADRLSGRPDRRTLYRVRVFAGRISGGVRCDRLDAITHDDVQALQGERGRDALCALREPQLRSFSRLVWPAAVRYARHLPGHDHLRFCGAHRSGVSGRHSTLRTGP